VIRVVALVLTAWLAAAGAQASEVLRIVLWDAGLSRDGPGLLLRDLGRGDDQIAAVAAVLAEAQADIVVLTGTDVDAGNETLAALQARFGYANGFSRMGNAGLATGIDMDGDGLRNTPRDTQGYGEFTGDGGIVVLSRETLDLVLVRDFSGLLWRDFPDNLLEPGTLPEGVADIQRLSSTAHWLLRAGPLTLMVYAAAPPVFDGPEDRNGRRNHDETALWLRLLEGAFGAPPVGPVVLIGKTNTDLVDGDGRPEALAALIAHPRLQDPEPRSEGAVLAADPEHRGDPALDTADFDGPGPGPSDPMAPTPGNLRVDYILPSTVLEVLDAGVIWPAEGTAAQIASRHGLVWVDLRLPPG